MSNKKSGGELSNIGTGVEECWKNAKCLIESARKLKEDHHALALSVSILAMEEIGKMILIDGLLFSEKYKERKKLFEKGFEYHNTKLQVIDAFPLLVNYLAILDKRYDEEEAYNKTIAIKLKQYQEFRKKLENWIESSAKLEELNKWKQKGFYVDLEGNSYIRPQQAVSEEITESVFYLSECIIDTVDFILKDNIETYKKRIKKLRQTLSEEEIDKIHERAEKIITHHFKVPDET